MVKSGYLSRLGVFPQLCTVPVPKAMLMIPTTEPTAPITLKTKVILLKIIPSLARTVMTDEAIDFPWGNVQIQVVHSLFLPIILCQMLNSQHIFHSVIPASVRNFLSD